MGKNLDEEQNWEAAAARFRQAVSANPLDVVAWNNLGSAEIKCGRPRQAKDALDEALKLVPDHPKVVANYAYVLCCLDMRKEAWDWLTARIVSDPNSADQWGNLSGDWASMGEWKLAGDACRRALALSPEHPVARQVLAHVIRAQSSFAAAENLIHKLPAPLKSPARLKSKLRPSPE